MCVNYSCIDWCSIDIRAAHALDVCSDTFMSRIYWHGIELGKDEFDVLPTSSNYTSVSVPYTSDINRAATPMVYADVLKHVSNRLSWYYAGRVHDMWAPSHQYNALKSVLPLSRWSMMSSLSHAWPAYIDESKALARSCAAEIMDHIWNDRTNLLTIESLPPVIIPHIIAASSSSPFVLPSSLSAGKQVVTSRL